MNLPYFWDKTADTALRPELNPLANPALERNLSRWAEAYFGNPPGKREAAINRLLQEIKNETSEILIAEQARRESSVRSTEAQAGRCPTCQHQNPVRQRFCGQCGRALSVFPSTLGNGSTFTATQASADAAPRDSEVQWLRDRALGSLDVSEAPARQGWKYVLGGLMIALAGFAYLQWNPRHLTRVIAPVTAVAPRITNPAPPLPTATPSSAAAQRPPEAIASAPASSVPEPSGVQSALATPEAQIVHDRKTGSAGIQPAVQRSSLLGAASMPKAVERGDGGSADLRLAQRYLGGSMGVRDSSEAAKLLWKSVGKQNTTAAILLSGLYARGDGVPKSCDQARLLLLAATRHGAPHAAEQLRNLEQRGCQ